MIGITENCFKWLIVTADSVLLTMFRKCALFTVHCIKSTALGVGAKSYKTSNTVHEDCSFIPCAWSMRSVERAVKKSKL